MENPSIADGGILVTGGLGFIGQALIARLRGEGLAVRVLDDLSNAAIPPQDAEALGAEVRIGDIRDPAACRVAAEGMTQIVHLAAQTSVSPSIEDPWRDLEANGRGTLNLLEAGRHCGVTRFILASSNSIVGVQPPPFNESIHPQPVSPYGCTKLLSECYCRTYAALYGITTLVLRFSNVYGPGSSRKGSVVATFMRRALAGEPLVIHGDGWQTRDFLFIDDLVDAIALCRAVPAQSEIYCIGSGAPVSVRDLAARIGRLYERWRGATLKVTSGPSRLGDVEGNWSDISKARSRLGFRPAIGLDQGLERTFRWFVEHWLPAQGHGAASGHGG